MKQQFTPKFYLFLFAILILATGLTACADEEITPLPVPTATAIPTATPRSFNANSTIIPATPTPIPTVTPLPPTATAVPPTATPAPTVTPVPATPTALPPTATPVPTTASPEVVGKASPATSVAPVAPQGYAGKLVFDTTDQEIFIINPDGSGRRKVTNGSSPLFSPDGTRVAFVAREKQADDFDKVTISSVKLDGSDRQNYCELGGNAAISLIRWSPRNRFIAVNVTQNGPGGISLCNLAERKLVPVFETQRGPASLVFDWTPDGENVLWQSGFEYTDQTIYYGDPDKAGEGAVVLPNLPVRRDLGGFKYYPVARFSPDGKTIAIGGGSLYFANTPGQKSSLAGKNYVGAGVENLAWSPDGRALALLSSEASAEPGKTVLVLHIQDLSSKPYAGPTVNIDQKLAGGLDWTR